MMRIGPIAPFLCFTQARAEEAEDDPISQELRDTIIGLRKEVVGGED